MTNTEKFSLWDGGRTFTAGVRVEVVTVSGERMVLPAELIDWSITGCSSDVAFYRVMYSPPGQNTAAKNTAPVILHRAAGIMEERGKQYDQPNGERSMGKAVSAFNTITGKALLESEGWLLMQILKDVRDRQKKEAHVDSLEDCVAYSALKAESRLAGR